MSRISPLRLLVLAAALVTSSLTVLAPSAGAEGGTVATRIHAAGYSYLDDPTRVRIAGSVTRDATSSNVYGVTGTVTFTDEHGTVIAAGVPVASDNGYVYADAPMPTGPTTYTLDFHGTGDFADSTFSFRYTPSTLRTVTVTPEPSLVKITAGSLKLTLTLAAYARFNDGTGAPGVRVDFQSPCLRDPRTGMCTVAPIPWCSAVSDANGLASCKASGLLGSLVSILNGMVTFWGYSTPTMNVVNAPGPIPLVVRS